MTPADALLVGAAGVLAGAINAVAGGGTLVSFPALLAAGLPPIAANVTSSVGLLAGYAGGSVAYRRELEGQRGRVRALAPAAILGGVAGAALLLVTPEATFRDVVPYLVLMSSALLALQPRLGRALVAGGRGSSDVHWGARLGVGVAAVYGSYFGAGLGVLLLAVLGILVADDLQRLNALKGLLSLLINVVGVLVFLFSDELAWRFVVVLAVGAYLGGTLGVSLARRLPEAMMRTGIVAVGLVVGIVMLVR
jgi:uncharacterized membrane protein YfcA